MREESYEFGSADQKPGNLCQGFFWIKPSLILVQTHCYSPTPHRHDLWTSGSAVPQICEWQD